MFLGLDLGTSAVKALLVDADNWHRRQPVSAAFRQPAASGMVGTGSRVLVAGRQILRFASSNGRIHPDEMARWRHRAVRADARADSA